MDNSSIQHKGGQLDIFESLSLPIVEKPNEDERTEWVMVTPDVAKKLLGINYDKQRNINRSRVDLYARDMKNGHWNSQSCNPIRISSDGKVIDGQHRLLAVVESGASIPMKIVFGGGNAEELFDYMDNTLSRTAAQFLKTKNANAVAALSKAVLCLKHGSTLTSALKGAYKYIKTDNTTISQSPTRLEIVEHARENASEFEEITTKARAINASIGANPLTIGLAIWCITKLHNAYMLDEYVDGFKDLAPENRTIALAQATILRKVSQAKQQRVTVDKSWTFGVFAYGYDEFAAGKTIKSVRLWEKTLRTYSLAMQDMYSQKKDGDDDE